MGYLLVLWKNDNQLENKKTTFHHDDVHDDDDNIYFLINVLKEKIPYFAMYNMLLCIMHTHGLGPDFQGNGISTTYV